MQTKPGPTAELCTVQQIFSVNVLQKGVNLLVISLSKSKISLGLTTNFFSMLTLGEANQGFFLQTLIL